MRPKSNWLLIQGTTLSGLGFECAKALSKGNPSRLILAVRNTAAGEKAARDIVSSNPSSVKTIPEVWKLDLSDLASVKAFGERAEKELDRLDIVVGGLFLCLDVARTEGLSVSCDVHGRSRMRGSAQTNSN